MFMHTRPAIVQQIWAIFSIFFDFFGAYLVIQAWHVYASNVKRMVDG